MADTPPNQVTLDAQTYQNLTTVAGIVDRMMQPDAKAEFEPVFKKFVNPNYITDKDRAAPHVNPLLERLEQLEKKLKGVDEEKIDSQLASKFKALKDNFGVTDDGIETVKKYMVEHRIADPEDAWFAYKGREPAAPIVPNGMQPASWGFQDTSDEDSKAIWSDGPEFDNYLARIWNETKK